MWWAKSVSKLSDGACTVLLGGPEPPAKVPAPGTRVNDGALFPPQELSPLGANGSLDLLSRQLADQPTNLHKDTFSPSCRIEFQEDLDVPRVTWRSEHVWGL